MKNSIKHLKGKDQNYYKNKINFISWIVLKLFGILAHIGASGLGLVAFIYWGTTVYSYGLFFEVFKTTSALVFSLIVFLILFYEFKLPKYNEIKKEYEELIWVDDEKSLFGVVGAFFNLIFLFLFIFCVGILFYKFIEMEVLPGDFINLSSSSAVIASEDYNMDKRQSRKMLYEVVKRMPPHVDINFLDVLENECSRDFFKSQARTFCGTLNKYGSNKEKNTADVFKNGQKKEVKKEYYENGNLKSATIWHANGNKMLEIHYKDGIKEKGILTEWYENGQKQNEGQVKNIKEEGLWTHWFENGSGVFFKSEIHYKNGKRDGSWTIFKKDEEIGIQGQYEDGLKQGYWVSWMSKAKGTKWFDQHYKNGLLDGLSTKWWGNGDKRSKIYYKDGIADGLWTEWYGNGKKESERHYKDGIEDGLWTEWYGNGQKKSERHYKNGKKEGLSVGWKEDPWHWLKSDRNDSEKKRYEGNYKNGVLDGLYTEWYQYSNVKESEGYYKDGEKDGLWTEWSEDGKTKSEIHYKDGKEK